MSARDKTPRTHDASPTPSPTAAIAATDHGAARLHALVIADDFVATYPLPDTGVVKIGRVPQCEIVIDSTSISRTHASLSIGAQLVLTDLGSANGTRVRDRTLAHDESIEIASGEAFQVGTATVIVQRRVAPIRPRRLWTHDYFEVRLEEECARAARRGIAFALMRVSCTSDTPRETVQEAVTEFTRTSDVVGEYGPADYEILLVDTAPEEVVHAERRLMIALEAQGITVRVGTACYPRDARSSDELMARADAMARGLAPQADVGRTERTMQDLYTLASRVANSTISVLILGETGVGKEVLAEKVHTQSPRAAKPYLRLNCAALSESLLESELFGHEKGAFTGAIQTKPGLLETADGGSVFLDEVGELPPSIQVKLLRVIEAREVMRVGSVKPKRIDVRFVSATNRDLEAEIARGTFRQDLYFRLNGATLVIPPLRERPTEIAGLARAFLDSAARQANLAKPPELTRDALRALQSYSWPGNIRELRNVIERAVLLADGGAILQQHLPLEKMRVTLANSGPRQAAAKSSPLLRRGPKLSLDEERAQIEAALKAAGGNQTRAAKLLGVARGTLINRVKEFGLTRPRGR